MEMYAGKALNQTRSKTSEMNNKCIVSQRGESHLTGVEDTLQQLIKKEITCPVSKGKGIPLSLSLKHSGISM